MAKARKEGKPGRNRKNLTKNLKRRIREHTKEKDFVKIHVNVLQHVTQGASIKLPVKVVYKTSKEQTGFITLSILNHDTQKSIDGWCINIFPFQYFPIV